MFEPNANKSNNNKDVMTLDDNNQNSTMMPGSGVVSDEISSPSSLLYHSHSSKQGKQGNYKSVMTVSSHGPFENIHNQCHNPSQGAFSKDGNASFVPFIPPSLISKQNDNMIHSVESKENDIEFKPVFIPSKIKIIKDNKDDQKMESSLIYNPWSSFSVNFECSVVCIKICQILSNYNKLSDIEYNVHSSDQYKIDGIIFMTDHQYIFFMISIYYNKHDENKENISKSKIEFVRKSGDSLSFSRFCCDIKDIYLSSINATGFDFGGNGNNDGGSSSFSSLLTPLKFINTLPNDDNLNGYQSEEEILKELDTFNIELNADDEYVADHLKSLLLKLGQIIHEKHILNHDKIINTLIQTSLRSLDICIVRGALIILISIIEKCQQINICKQLLNEQTGPKLFYSIINILNYSDGDDQNQYIQFSMLIKKYAIRLLSKLTSFSNQINCFKNNQQFIKSFKNFKFEWIKQNNDKYHGFNNNTTVQQNMLNQIEATFLN